MTSLRTIGIGLLCLGMMGASVSSAWAQRSNQSREELEGVNVERNLGDQIPTDLTFEDEEGTSVSLDQYFDGETPVLLNLVYHDCPMLCGLMLNGFTSSLKSLSWTPGEQYRVLTVSFNHREGPAIARENKKTYVEQLGRPEAADGWHFLTGDSTAIQELTAAVGFNFRWVPEKQEYAHPTAQVFLSGDGKITRYIYGIEIPSSDMRKALVEASNGTVGNAIDQAAMYCFQFDPDENTYTADAFNIMKIGSVLVFLLLAGALFIFWRQEHKDLERHEAWADRVPSTG